MEISPNVDDLLIEQTTGKALEPLPEKVENVPHETINNQDSHQAAETKPIEQAAEKPKTQTNEYGDKSEPSSKPEQSDDKTTNETDEYGLEAEQKKTYSQAEMDAYANRLIRERLARLERNNPPPQPTQQQQQQANQQGFQYDENSNLDWQQQLEQFTMQVIDKRENMRAQQTQQAKERQRMAEFEGKFRQGMDKFNDYHEVVGGHDITDHMVMAARGINDPASFFYAAAKRAPDELAKIAKEPDPFAQAAAIGRLDAQLRKQAVTKVSSAPKPVSQTKADTTAAAYQPKQSSGNELDDLLLAENAKRISLLNARRR